MCTNDSFLCFLVVLFYVSPWWSTADDHQGRWSISGAGHGVIWHGSLPVLFLFLFLLLCISVTVVLVAAIARSDQSESVTVTWYSRFRCTIRQLSLSSVSNLSPSDRAILRTGQWRWGCGNRLSAVAAAAALYRIAQYQDTFPLPLFSFFLVLTGLCGHEQFSVCDYWLSSSSHDDDDNHRFSLLLFCVFFLFDEINSFLFFFSWLLFLAIRAFFVCFSRTRTHQNYWQ